jgi:hypothetical protein
LLGGAALRSEASTLAKAFPVLPTLLEVGPLAELSAVAVLAFVELIALVEATFVLPLIREGSLLLMAAELALIGMLRHDCTPANDPSVAVSRRRTMR